MILVHGFPDSARTWDAVVAGLAGAGVRAIVPDVRGYGKTRITDPVLGGAQQAALARDILELASALKFERFGIIGHDWGCRAGAGASVLAPERVAWLVAVDGYSLMASRDQVKPYPPSLEREYWYQWYFATERGARALRDDRQSICATLQRLWTPPERPAPFEETFAAFENDQFVDVVLHSYRHRYGWAADVPAYTADENRLAQRPPVPVPSIALFGALDPLTANASYLDGRDRFDTLVDRRIVEGAGHFVQRDAPAVVIEAALKLKNR